MSYFIKHVSSYQKYTRTEKGQIAAGIAHSLEHMVLDDREAIQALQESLEYMVHKLNVRFPRQKEWVVNRTHYDRICIKPATGKGFDDEVVYMNIVQVKGNPMNGDDIHWHIKRMYLESIDEKGGAE